MPTIFIFFGFRFMFYSNDHMPIHVHIIKDGNEAKYNVEPVEQRINKVWVDDAHVWAETTNGWKAGYPFKQWRNLANATPEQRQNFFLSRYGIHWPELDEDLNFEGMFADAGLCKRSDGENAIYYQA